MLSCFKRINLIFFMLFLCVPLFKGSLLSYYFFGNSCCSDDETSLETSASSTKSKNDEKESCCKTIQCAISCVSCFSHSNIHTTIPVKFSPDDKPIMLSSYTLPVISHQIIYRIDKPPKMA